MFYGPNSNGFPNYTKPIKYLGTKLLTKLKKIVHQTIQKAMSYKTYDDSVDAGTPSPAQNRGYIRYVALLAIVDPFEHAICCLKLEIHIWFKEYTKEN